MDKRLKYIYDDIETMAFQFLKLYFSHQRKQPASLLKVKKEHRNYWLNYLPWRMTGKRGRKRIEEC